MNRDVLAIALEALDRALHHVLRADTVFRESDKERDAEVRGDVNAAEDAIRLARRSIGETLRGNRFAIRDRDAEAHLHSAMRVGVRQENLRREAKAYRP